MSSEPVTIVVAKAKVKGAPNIELPKNAEFKAQVNQKVQVKCLYRLEETSREKEEWNFSLATSIGAQKQPDASAKWEDRWGLNDSLWGVLQQEYIFDKPGVYEGKFAVHVSHTEKSWQTKQVHSKSDRAADGTFRIRVVK